jgi:hypothetical protein
MYAPYTRFIEWYIVHIFFVFSNVLLDLLQIVILSGWFSSSLNNVNSLFFVYLLLFICQIHYGRVEGGDKVYNFFFCYELNSKLWSSNRCYRIDSFEVVPPCFFWLLCMRK